jgi:hypothetical protein
MVSLGRYDKHGVRRTSMTGIMGAEVWSVSAIADGKE